MGTLNRNQMEQVIRSGGSVLHGGRIITKIEHLPNDADLARGNPEQEQQVLTTLQDQIQSLQRQYDTLTGGRQGKAAKPSGGQPPQGQGQQDPKGNDK